ncbi:hypothetical protein B0J14DRAFT_618002 [Halenospora varia]|nr:hypothetical protein B0J14DRAFT_618002 [Halenospora varia]
MLKILPILFLFVEVSRGQDPVKNFCRRFGHQSTIVDRKLYIDGGQTNWEGQGNITNPWLLYNDLDVVGAKSGMPQLYANWTHNSTIPSVSGGILWPDSVNKRLYSYGGDNPAGTPVEISQFLSYDIARNQWDAFGTPSVQSVSWGGGVGVSELGKGFVLGGWLSNNSVPGWIGDPVATSNLIQYDMDQKLWKNSSGPDTTPKAEGVMVYLPASDSGLLVYFGGIIAPSGNSTTIAANMSTIHIFDISGGKWYTQTAVGTIPQARRRFCAGAAWSPDRSSYNIYLYGGLGFDENGPGFDDIYILSLPTFTWIKFFDGSTDGVPHHSLTCNVIGGQMLVIGGTFPLGKPSCDTPEAWGTHNVDMGKQSGSQWQRYQTNLSYVVPPEVIAVVGGSSQGSATIKSPAAGFSHRDLQVYFAQTATVALRTPTATPTSTSSESKLSSGTIGGIAAGCAIAFLAIFAGITFFFLRHRKNKLAPSAPPPPTDYEPQTMFHNNHDSIYSNGRESKVEPQLLDSIPSPRITEVAELSGSMVPNHGLGLGMGSKSPSSPLAEFPGSR